MFPSNTRIARPTRLLASGLAAVALAAAAGGCGDDTSDTPPDAGSEGTTGVAETGAQGQPLKKEDLAALWYSREQRRVMQFRADGTFAIDDRGTLATDPAAAGRYQIDGRDLRFTSAGAGVCEEGDTWVFQARAAQEGRLETVVTDDAEGDCSAGEGTTWRWIQVSPAPADGAPIEVAEGGEPQAIPEPSALTGVWPLRGGELVLAFGENGRYWLDDEGQLGKGADDAGIFELNDGRLTFTSGARSRTRQEGARLIWTQPRLTISPLTRDPAGVAEPRDWTLATGEIDNAECHGSIPDDAQWIRLSR